MTALEGRSLLAHGTAIARRYAKRIGPEAAEELRAEATLRALRSPPPDGRMEPWLERIYRNLLVDRWRRGRACAGALSSTSELADTVTPEQQALAGERRRIVRKHLCRLPRAARRALLSRYFVELDDHATAHRLGVTAATVRTRIHRALLQLRARLGDLRACFPPLLGKLGAQTSALALAPVMLALVVTSAPPAPPEPEAATTVEYTVARPRSLAVVDRVAPPEAVLPGDVPRKPTHTSKRPLAPAPPRLPVSDPPTAPLLDFGEREPTTNVTVLAEILQPETVDVFAEPERPPMPCMVEAPPSFLVQIDKMIDSL
jgi:RNA polymerase sigma factor (sigma-70 family)